MHPPHISSAIGNSSGRIRVGSYYASTKDVIRRQSVQ